MRTFTFKPSFTLKGRQFNGLRGFAGKPFHPPLTDIPIGAYTLAPAFDLISFIGRNKGWGHDFHQAATFTFIGGALVSLLTALTGFMDWLKSTEKGTQARRTVNAHAWTMITMTVLVLVDIAWRWTSDAAYTPAGLLILSLVIAVIMFLGSTMGGTLVYDYGFNVENSTDHPVWHVSERDVMPGQKDFPGDETS
jgi:uncharacterized membrane protein